MSTTSPTDAVEITETVEPTIEKLVITSKRYLRLMLRSLFGIIEGYLCPVVKAIARQNREWGGEWFEELQNSVGRTMQKQMRHDNEWDAYTICMILKKHFRRVFFSSIEDESLVDRLFMCVNHLGTTRDRLSHNGDPSCAEILYCMEACIEIVNSLPPPDSLTLDPTVALRELTSILENCNLAMSLVPGDMKEMVISKSDYCLDLLDSMFSIVEKDFGQRFLEAGIQNRSMDVQFVIQTLLNIPGERLMKETLRQRATTEKKDRKIEIDESSIEKISERAKEENVNLIKKLLMDGVITIAQAESLRIELGEGKHPILAKVTPEDIKNSVSWTNLTC